eukprot:scaffold4009_cov230-Prasinococcus_capsulatus_cf.AAC.4
MRARRGRKEGRGALRTSGAVAVGAASDGARELPPRAAVHRHAHRLGAAAVHAQRHAHRARARRLRRHAPCLWRRAPPRAALLCGRIARRAEGTTARRRPPPPPPPIRTSAMPHARRPAASARALTSERRMWGASPSRGSTHGCSAT